MSGSGAPVVEPVDAAGLTLGIVATTWHAEITGALLDRLTHHVNILEMNGESYRLNQSRARLAAANK